jgi:uncharacterized SAM-binding protein YcdF (DUF218 family)
VKAPTPAPRRILVVLGGTNTRAGRLSPMSVRRLRRALGLFRARPAGTVLLLTGGFGAHFNVTRRPHHAYARAWLRRQGVAEDRFLPGAASAHTPDDARLCAEVLRRHPAAAVTLVTSDFHAARARHLFRRALGTRRFRVAVSACLAAFPPARRRRLQEHERTRLAGYRAEDRAARA